MLRRWSESLADRVSVVVASALCTAHFGRSHWLWRRSRSSQHCGTAARVNAWLQRSFPPAAQTRAALLAGRISLLAAASALGRCAAVGLVHGQRCSSTAEVSAKVEPSVSRRSATVDPAKAQQRGVVHTDAV